MTKPYKQEKQYILDNINADGYDIPEPQTDKGKVQFLYNTFHSEYDFQIERLGQFQALQGLPSSISIAFTNYDILQLAQQWGSLPDNATVKQEYKVLENYWRFMAMRIQGLFRQYKLGE